MSKARDARCCAAARRDSRVGKLTGFGVGVTETILAAFNWRLNSSTCLRRAAISTELSGTGGAVACCLWQAVTMTRTHIRTASVETGSCEKMENFPASLRVIFLFYHLSPFPILFCSNSQFASWMRLEPGGLWHALGGGVAPCAFASGVAGAELYPDFYAGG